MTAVNFLSALQALQLVTVTSVNKAVSGRLSVGHAGTWEREHTCCMYRTQGTLKYITQASTARNASHLDMFDFESTFGNYTSRSPLALPILFVTQPCGVVTYSLKG